MTAIKPEKRLNATEKTRTPWGERIEASLRGRSAAWLAREVGISPSSLGEMIRKAMPGADTALRIADALGVDVDWLITGRQRPRPSLIAADQADWVMVPRYDLGAFTDDGKPEPIENIALRKDWLNRTARRSKGLFLTELPPNQYPELGEEGDTILCQDATHHEAVGVYLYRLDGLPLVRKFSPIDEIDRARTPLDAWEPEDPPGLRIVARILGTIKMRPV